jgi:hypothetical protein
MKKRTYEPKLTVVQERAYLLLSDKWQCAYELKCSLATLNALVLKGYAERTSELGASFFPRTSINFRLKMENRNDCAGQKIV